MKPMNANELLAGLALARPVPITAVVTDSRKVQPGCILSASPASVWTPRLCRQGVPGRGRVCDCQPSRGGRAGGSPCHL